MDRIRAYARVWWDDTAIELFDELDFIVSRSNYQANPRERYLYQTYRAMTPFYNLLGGTAVACAGIVFAKRYKLRLPLVVGLLAGSFYSLVYQTAYKPKEFANVCRLEDNYYGQLAKYLVQSHPRGHVFRKAVDIGLTTEIQRDFYAVPNFQYSGLPAVLGFLPGETPPEHGTPLDRTYFLTDIYEALKKFRATSPIHLKDPKKRDSNQLRALLHTNVHAYMATQGIERPPYFQPLDEAAAAKRALANAEAKVRAERTAKEIVEGVNFMHVYNDPRETSGKDMPLPYGGTASDMIQHYSSPDGASTLPPDPHQQYRYLAEMREQQQQQLEKQYQRQEETKQQQQH